MAEEAQVGTLTQSRLLLKHETDSDTDYTLANPDT